MHATTQAMAIETFLSGEGNLSYLLTAPGRDDALLIDPDLEILGVYLLKLDRLGRRLAAVIDTHTHADHATAGPALHALTGAPYLMHQAARASAVTQRLSGDEALTLAGIALRTLPSPGHTPDHLALLADGHLFSGDALFHKGSGRTDFPGGDAGQAFDTLQRLLALPEATVLHPGHDYNHQLTSTLAEVKQQNPRAKMADRDAFIAFMAEAYRDNEKPDDWAYYLAFNTR